LKHLLNRKYCRDIIHNNSDKENVNVVKKWKLDLIVSIGIKKIKVEFLIWIGLRPIITGHVKIIQRLSIPLNPTYLETHVLLSLATLIFWHDLEVPYFHLGLTSGGFFFTINKERSMTLNLYKPQKLSIKPHIQSWPHVLHPEAGYKTWKCILIQYL
jgi:hypothetical protein